MTTQNINKEQFEKEIQGRRPVLVEFWAPGVFTAGVWVQLMTKLDNSVEANWLLSRSTLTKSRILQAGRVWKWCRL